MGGCSALYGYPYWEDSGYSYWMFPCDGVIARFRADTEKISAYDALLQRGLIKRFAFHTNGNPLKDGIVLYLTSRCNCSCDYCEANIGSPVTDMSYAVLNAAFEFCVWVSRGIGSRRLSVTLLGGEPTLKTDMICGLAERFKLAGADVNISLCTNGMIRDCDLGRLLEYDNIEWRISLDIPEEQYAGLDYRSGSRYDLVFRTIREVAARGRAHVIRTTVTKRNMHLMDEIALKCVSLGANKITYTPLRVAYGKSLDLPDSAPDVEEYMAAWYAVRQFCRRERLDINVADSHFDMLFGKGTLYCSSIFIMPDGTILPTTSEAYVHKRLCVGNVTERDWTGVEAKLNKLKKQFLLDVEKDCADCAGRHICGGGAMAAEFYMGTKRQGRECLYLRRMITEAAERINAHELTAVEKIQDIQLLDYINLKNYI